LTGDATSLAYAQVKPPDPPSTKPIPVRSDMDEIDELARRLAIKDALAAASASSALAQRGVFLQLGAFSNADNAESLRSHFIRELDWLHEGIQINTWDGIHRVHLGPYPNRAEAEKVAEKIKMALGQKPTIVTR